VVVDYSYSAASQPTGITYQSGSTTLGNLTYGYDSNGRMTSVGGTFARTGLPQPVSSATYDAANELTQWGTTSLSYDLNGNLTGDGVNTYTWNARNQLASLNAGNVFNFQYDALDRRIQNAVGNQLLYDGANAVQENAGGSPVSSRLTGGMDEFFTRTDASGTFSPLTDALGSTVALSDAGGNLQTQYTYEPFGNTTSTGPANANPFQFTGREMARDYTTIVPGTTARFISDSFPRTRWGSAVGSTLTPMRATIRSI
jgi:hypothetical protein